MKLTLEKKTDTEKCYVAEIRGLDHRYRFERDFLKGTWRELRPNAKMGLPRRMRGCYDLRDGIYEVCEVDNRSYLAVVNNRRIQLHVDHISIVERACKDSGLRISSVFERWADSSKRSSKSLAAMAKDMAAPYRAMQAAAREEADRKAKEASKRHAEARRERVRTMTAREAYEGSDAADTRGVLRRLEQVGAEGAIAAQLFRAQKASSRAKQYRGGRANISYRNLAYDKKAECLGQLCALLTEDAHGMNWGWKLDPTEPYAQQVLYVDLPVGQVSFHSTERMTGPDYDKGWDGCHASEDRIIEFCNAVLGGDVSQKESPLQVV